MNVKLIAEKREGKKIRNYLPAKCGNEILIATPYHDWSRWAKMEKGDQETIFVIMFIPLFAYSSILSPQFSVVYLLLSFYFLPVSIFFLPLISSVLCIQLWSLVLNAFFSKSTELKWPAELEYCKSFKFSLLFLLHPSNT